MSEARFDPDFGWEPAIPLPLYTWGWFGSRKRFVCECGEAFKQERSYEEHYARTHWVVEPIDP